MRYTFKEWLVHCDPCDQNFKILEWAHKLPILCPLCDKPTALWSDKWERAPGVVGDDIPGGIEIRHLSPNPEKFYSRTEIKRACNERGWTWNGDTPKPYNVPWSGRRKDAKEG